MKAIIKGIIGIFAVGLVIGGVLFFRKGAVPIQATAQEKVSWELILVNKTHEIPDNYQVDLQELANEQAVDKRIYQSLQEMFDAARVQGVNPKISSSYRTHAEQIQIMEDKIAGFIQQGYTSEKAKVEAEKWVAIPGTSEHELGLAVDINATETSSDKEVYNWLAKNAYQYGFILRYPSNKVQLTGVDYEPWHYRYVGKKAAKDIYQSGVCLEEYTGSKTS
ncbi:zinc D-Ala-D-Ala carboxypeptidase [Enterococcus sp. AZ194]|uniref:M15 family metallopeptidase n=1 Tax=Enterococcus sp. AZ194 TaxID=2774629 RepID=UPI003F241BED